MISSVIKQAAKIFAEYHKRLRYYVNQAKDAQRSSVNSSSEIMTSFHSNNKKGNKSADDVILIETTIERNVRKVCESLAVQMSEKIRSTFPAYEGSGIHSNPQMESSKLGIDVDGDLPAEVTDVIVDCLKTPPHLLQAIISYTQRLRTLITREIEKIDVKADAEALRYKYENNTIIEASSPDVSSPLQYHLYGYGKQGGDTAARGTEYQLLERQKAHVQQFLATEDALNKAAEARKMSQLLLKRLHGSGDSDSSQSLVNAGTSQSMSSLRQLELEVWAKEREAAGLKASLNTLMSEVHRLNQLCAEREEAENLLRKKWKKIEEFDARRSELESIYNALLKANMALLESMGANGSTGPEVASAERNAAVLAGARDPSAIPSICHISAALQYPAGLDGLDAGLASVLESMEFCLKLRGSEATVLEDLSKAINLVHVRRDLVESGHSLLNHAHNALQEYDRTTNYFSKWQLNMKRLLLRSACLN